MKHLLSTIIAAFFLMSLASCEKDETFFLPCGPDGAPIDGWEEGDTIIPPSNQDSAGFDIRLHPWEQGDKEDLDV